MNYLLFSRPFKRGVQTILLLAILVINFSAGNTRIAYAIPPTNDDFDSATVIGAIPYSNSISTLEATEHVDDPQVNILCDNKLLKKGLATVWYRYTPDANRQVFLDTIGTNYDNYIAVWTGSRTSLSLVACDDDVIQGFDSKLSFTALGGTTYYIEVAQYNGNQGSGASATDMKSKPGIQALSGGSLHLHVYNSPADVNVFVAGSPRGEYYVESKGNLKLSYTGMNNGPIKVQSLNGLPIVTSERVAYSPDGGTTWTSFSELMGVPSSQLTTSYTFPWYNNVELNSQIRFGNVGTTSTNVTVTIGGAVQGTYPLLPNQSKRISYAGLNNGPVQVTSSASVPIIASMRVAYFNGTVWTDFSEMMGLPTSSLSTHYSFPVYNNIDLNSQMRFGNAGTTSTNVTVTIGGVVQGTYPLLPNQSKRISYAGLDSGPVVVQSSGGVPIIASERVAYFNGSAWTSFAEMMGLPLAQLTTTYLFPWYNNVDINTQLRFGVP
ncbi:MAG: hypothetical protein ABIU06_07925 [Anaerolineales bacterium]